jgi:Right handed beta helix region
MAFPWFAKLFGSSSRRPESRRRPARTQLDVEILEARITPQASRTWVSGVGDDANPCSRTAPGKTFAGAISKTAQGGEIDVLDSGGFGALTILHSITIDGAGNLGGVLVAGTNGFTINAGPTDIVVIRGLTFDGGSLTTTPGLNGIRINSAGVVDIENCVIENFSKIGIDFEPTNAGAKLFVSNTVVRNCATGGVQVQPFGGVNALAAMDNVQSNLNFFGFGAIDNSIVSIHNSVASGNTRNGFIAASTSIGTRLSLDNDMASNNGTNGVRAVGGGALISMSNVDSFGNSALGSTADSGSTIFSFGNNRQTDNSKGFIPIAIPVGTVSPAGATRTWVSGVGDDANPCSRTAPGKTFAGAISKTADGGEIDVLDPGGFGGITITKSIALDGSGSFGSILVAGTNGIVINAGPNDVVVIRGIKINGINSGLNGINILQAGAVFVENCIIQNFTQNGINFVPGNAGCQLFVENTTFENCGGAGVQLQPSAAATNTRANFDKATAKFDQAGFAILDSADATFFNSTAVGNQLNGFVLIANSFATVVNIESSTSSDNGTNGLRAQGGAAVTGLANLSRVNISQNLANGLVIGANPATTAINSFGNIQVGDNTVNGAPNGMLAQN